MENQSVIYSFRKNIADLIGKKTYRLKPDKFVVFERWELRSENGTVHLERGLNGWSKITYEFHMRGARSWLRDYSQSITDKEAEELIAQSNAKDITRQEPLLEYEKNTLWKKVVPDTPLYHRWRAIRFKLFIILNDWQLRVRPKPPGVDQIWLIKTNDGLITKLHKSKSGWQLRVCRHVGLGAAEYKDFVISAISESEVSDMLTQYEHEDVTKDINGEHPFKVPMLNHQNGIYLDTTIIFREFDANQQKG